MPSRVAVLLLGLLLAACTTESHLTYRTPPAAFGLVAPQPVIATVDTIDQRKERPRQLGTIMGGYGNPLKMLDTPRPVKDEVSAVVLQALEARNLSRGDGQGPLDMRLVLRSFDADQYIRSQANITLDMALVRRADGSVIYADSDTERTTRMDLMATGIFASINDLQGLCEQVLAQAIDAMLAKPQFHAAVGSQMGAPQS